jgi:hypothetical protein
MQEESYRYSWCITLSIPLLIARLYYYLASESRSLVASNLTEDAADAKQHGLCYRLRFVGSVST